MKCVKCVISGRVQGVGFRWSARRKANEMGISGYAENLSDGTVEICVSGENDLVDEFCSWFEENGPTFAKVKDVSYTTCDSCETFNGFEIR